MRRFFKSAAFPILLVVILAFVAQRVISPGSSTEAPSYNQLVGSKAQGGLIEQLLKDPAYSHIYFDISWNEVAKYVVATPESTKAVAGLMQRYPNRFLFGSDEVAPADQATYLRVYNQYEPLWKLLDAKTSEKVRKGNYERLFDAARVNVRAWERAHLK